MSKINWQSGIIAQALILFLLLASVGIGTYLVKQRTNLKPKAQEYPTCTNSCDSDEYLMASSQDYRECVGNKYDYMLLRNQNRNKSINECNKLNGSDKEKCISDAEFAANTQTNNIQLSMKTCRTRVRAACIEICRTSLPAAPAPAEPAPAPVPPAPAAAPAAAVPPAPATRAQPPRAPAPSVNIPTCRVEHSS